MASNWSWCMSDCDLERFIVLAPAALCLCSSFQSRFSAQGWATQLQRSPASKAMYELMRTAPQLGCTVLRLTPS